MAIDLFNQAAQLEGLTPMQRALALSIFGQESGYGKNPSTSTAGAKGFMQVMPTTFRQMADKGWDINDPMQNLRAGLRYIKYLDANHGHGDPWKIAVGYYGGPGAIAAAAKGQARYDKTNKNAPNTFEYADQVVARMARLAPSFAATTQGGDTSAYSTVFVPAQGGAPQQATTPNGGQVPKQAIDIAKSGNTTRSIPSLDSPAPSATQSADTEVLYTPPRLSTPSPHQLGQFLQASKRSSENTFNGVSYDLTMTAIPTVINGQDVMAVPTTDRDREFFKQVRTYPQGQQAGLVRAYAQVSPLADSIASKPLFATPQSDILDKQLRTIVEAA